jgi:hypothetical protein
MGPLEWRFRTTAPADQMKYERHQNQAIGGDCDKPVNVIG